ncbi:hypothetical protein M885DRAFT_511193 [Pelagophyceae sp. CCMP2097]|nr:hypothetical protein M885DRAFT_511193 [Pelagophyceae sp. CCMP2097]
MGLLAGLKFTEKASAAAPPLAGLKIMRGGGSDVAGDASKVGDGGITFRGAALRRYTEEAKDSGRTLEQVVAERWGTVENLLGEDAAAVKAAAMRPTAPGRAPKVKRSAPRFQQDSAPAKRKVPLGGDATDAAVLKTFSKKLESALQMNVGAEAPAPRPGDTSEWVGLNKHMSLGMKSAVTESMARGSKRRQNDDAAAPRAAVQTQAAAAAPREKRPPTFGEANFANEGKDAWRAAVQAQSAKVAPKDVSQARQTGSGNSDIAAMLRAKLGK